jgi:PAS domain S-box-containing protein
MPDALVYADAAGLILVWNAGAVRLFGFSESEALGQSLDIIMPASLRERHWHGFRETMRTGKTRYGDGQILAVPAVRKNGTRLSVEFTIVPFAAEDGSMTGIAAIMRDTTSRFEETRALRKQIAELTVGRFESQTTMASRHSEAWRLRETGAYGEFRPVAVQSFNDRTVAPPLVQVAMSIIGPTSRNATIPARWSSTTTIG